MRGGSKRLPTVTPEPHTRIPFRPEFIYSLVQLFIHSFIRPTSISKLPNSAFLSLPASLRAERQFCVTSTLGKDCIVSAHENSDLHRALTA